MTGFTAEELLELTRRLRGAHVGQRLVHVAACASTQDVAQQIAADGLPAAAGLVVLADHQEVGRGRLGKKWRQQPGRDLSFSLVMAPPSAVPAVTLAALIPAAVCLGIERTIGRLLSLKWPNDVYLQGRKLAGTLIEAFRSPGSGATAYVVGVGINVNSTDFDPEISATAVSLRQALGTEVDRAGLLATVLLEIDAAWREILGARTDGLVEVLRVRLGLVGKEVEIARGGQRIRGLVTSLGLDGFTLRSAGGEVLKVALEMVTAAAVV